MRWNIQKPLWTGLLILSVASTLAACGGGDSEETSTVAQVLNQSTGFTRADGVVEMSLFPQSGASLLAVNLLSKEGVNVLSRRCASFFLRDPATGEELMTVGGTPRYAVLAEVPSSEVAKAESLGFFKATPAFMQSSQVFECSTRDL